MFTATAKLRAGSPHSYDSIHQGSDDKDWQMPMPGREFERLTIPSSFKRMDTELGLYYLSYLHEACTEEQIRFESQVSLIPRNDLTVMTLSLQF